MKIFAISDLHLSINSNKPMNIFGPVWENYLEEIEQSWNSLVSEDDVVLIAGDISWAMKLEEAVEDLKYISKFKGKKILLKGNHDYWWTSVTALRNILPENMFVIQNDALKIGNYIFCGSRGWTGPDQPNFNKEDDEKIYNRELLRLELSLNEAKRLQTNNEKIIALTHFPPFNLQEKSDSDVTKILEKFGVSKVVFGHLHNLNAENILITEKNGITYYLTSCDLVNNQLIEIE